MGFTRNYKNLLMVNMCCPYGRTSIEYNNISKTFDDTNIFTIKATNGTLGLYLPAASGGLNIKDTTLSGEILSMTCETIGLLAGTNKSTDSRSCIKQLVFGIDTNEESVDDYTLNTISTITFDSQPKLSTYSYSNGKQINNYSCVIQNSSDVTISELGILAQIVTASSYGGNTSSSSTLNCLLYRKKLDTPIELTANEPQLVTFSIEFDYPV